MQLYTSSTKRITLIAFFGLLSGVISFFEVFLNPFIPIPGFKIGLANIIILFLLFRLPLLDTILTGVFKCIFSSALGGALSNLFYSLPATVISILIMYLIKKFFKRYVSVIGISIVGAMIHNIIQIIVSTILLRSYNFWYYYPYITIIGLIAGVVNGLIISKVKNLNFKIGI